MVTTPHNSNGHRRRQLRARVLAEETHCALCGGLVDKTLTNVQGQHGAKCSRNDCQGCVPHPMSAVVDEDVPRARGGSPYDRANCHLMHRCCNGAKSTFTISEYKMRNSTPQNAQIVTNLIEW